MNCFSNTQAISLLYFIISDISCPFWLLAGFPWQVQSLHIKLKESYSIILVCCLSLFLGRELLVNTVPSGCNFLLHIFWNHVRDCSWWAFQEPATIELVSLPASYSFQLLTIFFSPAAQDCFIFSSWDLNANMGDEVSEGRWHEFIWASTEEWAGREGSEHYKCFVKVLYGASILNQRLLSDGLGGRNDCSCVSSLH